MWKVWYQSFLQRYRRKCWGHVHIGNAGNFAGHSEFGALSNVSIGQLCTHSWSWKVSGTAGDAEFKWAGV